MITSLFMVLSKLSHMNGSVLLPMVNYSLGGDGGTTVIGVKNRASTQVHAGAWLRSPPHKSLETTCLIPKEPARNNSKRNATKTRDTDLGRSG